MQKTVIFLSIVLLLGLAAMGAYIWQNEQDKAAFLQQLNNQQAAAPVASPASTPVSTSATTSGQTDTNATMGTVTGTLSYPSEKIPEMKVCAVDVTTAKEFCTEERIEDSRFEYGVGYELDLPAGSYYVYAQRPEDAYKAYYNEFVTCGLAATCTSHELIAVPVTKGNTTSNINPIDWYDYQPTQ